MARIEERASRTTIVGRVQFPQPSGGSAVAAPSGSAVNSRLRRLLMRVRMKSIH